MRIYGGFIFVGGGDIRKCLFVACRTRPTFWPHLSQTKPPIHPIPIPFYHDAEFIGCLFYDYEIIATNDRIYLGGDVLVLAGEASFTGCVWIYSTWFAGEHGAGFNIAMLDGVSIFTFCEFNEFNAFLTTDGVGQAYMVVGAWLSACLVDGTLRAPGHSR